MPLTGVLFQTAVSQLEMCPENITCVALTRLILFPLCTELMLLSSLSLSLCSDYCSIVSLGMFHLNSPISLENTTLKITLKGCSKDKPFLSIKLSSPHQQ